MYCAPTPHKPNTDTSRKCTIYLPSTWVKTKPPQKQISKAIKLYKRCHIIWCKHIEEQKAHLVAGPVEGGLIWDSELANNEAVSRMKELLKLSKNYKEITGEIPFFMQNHSIDHQPLV